MPEEKDRGSKKERSREISSSEKSPYKESGIRSEIRRNEREEES